MLLVQTCIHSCIYTVWSRWCWRRKNNNLWHLRHHIKVNLGPPKQLRGHCRWLNIAGLADYNVNVKPTAGCKRLIFIVCILLIPLGGRPRTAVLYLTADTVQMLCNFQTVTWGCDLVRKKTASKMILDTTIEEEPTYLWKCENITCWGYILHFLYIEKKK